MFKEDREQSMFSWTDMGDIALGRPNLGDTTSVAVYRLMQYTLRDTLIRRFDPDTAAKIFYEAGMLAGKEFCENVLNTKLGFDEFVAQIQKTLRELRIGIFKLEKADLEQLKLTITVDEDLDCSGLPLCDETVCDYDEGFIAGILETYTGKPFDVKETDCWAMGGRTCRFDAKKKD